MDDEKDLRISKNRLEALVDSVFAFAMTLLVTAFIVPQLPKEAAKIMLAARIAEMKSEFISFLVAFFVLASFWLIHHRQFYFVRKIDHGIIRITLFILACVVLLPFTTNISGDYSDVQFAVNLFHANMFSLGMFFFLHWWYLTKHPDVTSAEISRRVALKGMYRCIITPFVSTVGFAISFANPSLSMAAYLLIIPCVTITRWCNRD